MSVHGVTWSSCACMRTKSITNSTVIRKEYTGASCSFFTLSFDSYNFSNNSCTFIIRSTLPLKHSRKQSLQLYMIIYAKKTFNKSVQQSVRQIQRLTFERSYSQRSRKKRLNTQAIILVIEQHKQNVYLFALQELVLSPSSIYLSCFEIIDQSATYPTKEVYISRCI